MNLIQNWRGIWRTYSIQAIAVGASIPAAWAVMPPEWRAMVPDGVQTWLMVAAFVCAAVGRVIDQGMGE